VVRAEAYGEGCSFMVRAVACDESCSLW
jgi:hypothetical protein